MPLLSRICEGEDCGKPIPEGRQLGAAYHSNACRQRAYRKREKETRTYMKLDKNDLLYAIDAKHEFSAKCERCNVTTSHITLGIYSNRIHSFCTGCLKLSRRRP